MSLKNTLFPLALTLLILMSGCKPKVAGETQSWAENQKKAADFKTKYPGFGIALDEAFANASKIWDEAAKITKEDDKAQKMRDANDAYGKLLDAISRYESNVESANSKQTAAYKKKYPSSVLRQIGADMSEASDKLESAITEFQNAKPANLEGGIKAATDAGDAAYDAKSKYESVIKKAFKK